MDVYRVQTGTKYGTLFADDDAEVAYRYSTAAGPRVYAGSCLIGTVHVALVLGWLPWDSMSRDWLLPLIYYLVMTLRTMEHFSVAIAVQEVDNTIIGSMEEEQEQAGDYVTAMLMQRNHLDRTFPDLENYDKVKERIDSQVKLAEMYWRYRAVKEGESVLEQTLKTLQDAVKTFPKRP